MSHYVRRIRLHTRMGPSFVLMAFAGRFHTARLFVRWLTRICRPRAIVAHTNLSASLLEQIDPVVAAESLKKDGLFSGLRLRESVCLELREALMAQTCYGAGRLEFPFLYEQRQEAERRYGKRFLQAHYYNLPTISRLVAGLASDPVLKRVGREYFDTEPVLVGVRAWWNFACGASGAQRNSAGQSFHYDMDDYLVLSTYFYLTDVDMFGGPHVCVRGSHGRKRFRHVWTPARVHTDEEVLGIYSADKILTLCGAAGYGFIEDAFCFHKGLHPETHDRLIVQIRYALHDYGLGSDEAHQVWAADTHT